MSDRSAPIGTLGELRDSLDRGEISSAHLVDVCLDRTLGLGAELNLFAGTRPEGARADAALADARRARGEVLSPLDGIPVAIKDNMVMEGEITTCASRILEGFRSPYSSTAVAKLRAAGSVIVGRTPSGSATRSATTSRASRT